MKKAANPLNNRMNPKTYTFIVPQASDYTESVANIDADYNTYARFCQITNLHAGQDVRVRLNGDNNACFTLEANTSQVFSPGDLQIRKIEFANDGSGSLDARVEVIIGVP